MDVAQAISTVKTNPKDDKPYEEIKIINVSLKVWSVDWRQELDFYFFTSRGTQTTKYAPSFLRKRRKWRGKKIRSATWSKWTCKILVQFGNNFGVTRDWNCDFRKGLLTKGTIARDMSLCNLTYSDSDKCTWQSSEYTWYFWMTDIKSETRGILSFTRVFQLTALAR